MIEGEIHCVRFFHTATTQDKPPPRGKLTSHCCNTPAEFLHNGPHYPIYQLSSVPTAPMPQNTRTPFPGTRGSIIQHTHTRVSSHKQQGVLTNAQRQPDIFGRSLVSFQTPSDNIGRSLDSFQTPSDNIGRIWFFSKLLPRISEGVWCCVQGSLRQDW